MKRLALVASALVLAVAGCGGDDGGSGGGDTGGGTTPTETDGGYDY